MYKQFKWYESITNMETVFGIDGCKYGWLVAGINKSNDFDFWFIDSLDKLNSITNQLIVAGIDIPLELHNSGKRLAESEARVLLKFRSSTIFSSPCILALDANSYLEACTINYAVCKKKISKQAWFLFKKIKDARNIYSADNLATKLYEVHPELSFMAMNNMEVVAEKKKTEEGVAKRIALIKKQYPLFNFNSIRNKLEKKYVNDDDILDSIAVLWSTQKIIDNIASYVPKNPETPMSKIYY